MRIVLLLVPLGLLFAAPGCIVVDKRDSSEVRRPTEPHLMPPIREANDEMERRFEAGDMAGVAAMYADDAVLLSARGSRHEGREAIDAYWARFQDPIRWDLDVFSVEGTESMPIQRGRSTMVRLVDGQEHTGVVEFFVIWRLEEDGEYRIVLDAYW